MGAFLEDELMSIVSFYEEEHPDLKASVAYRFRGMATLPEARKKGLASALLDASFEKLKHMKADLVWCNARTGALGLYRTKGMEIASEEFEIEHIGPHYLMKKDL